jgi:hypothetical protein
MVKPYFAKRSTHYPLLIRPPIPFKTQISQLTYINSISETGDLSQASIHHPFVLMLV